ncbi:MAG: hypothetical protein HKN25_02960 [Pyrinomonadaceae bacterium]|nr:hypothetical protein [Pyrinomonadaceae bacterium]
MKPNDREAAYCINCNTPMNLSSSNDPIERMPAEGYAYRKAAETKPNIVVLIGVWLLFLPTFVFCGLAVVGLIFGFYGGGFENFVWFWVSLIVAVFSLVMLYKVSKNYFYPPDYWDEEYQDKNGRHPET